MTLKSALASIALVGTLGAMALPHSVQAARASTAPVQTNVGGRPVVYHDSFSPAAQHKTDTSLGFATHWEGLVDVSNPSSPIDWTRVKTTSPAVTPASSLITRTHVRTASPAVTPHISCDPSANRCADTCTGSGGIRLWQNSNETGDCIKYTKYSSSAPANISLGGVQYPFSSNYVSNSQSFSTYGSNGSGQLICGGAAWSYGSNTNYGNLFVASGNRCDGTTGNLQTLHIN